MKKINVAVLSHLYYDIIEELFPLQHSSLYTTSFFFNVCAENNSTQFINERLIKNFPNCHITNSSNKGKDVGGKLVLIDLCLKLNVNADYYIFLHDKKSPHSTLGDVWRKKLFRIIEQEYFNDIVNLFEKDKTVGIVSSKEFIVNEYDESSNKFNCSSNLILHELISNYSLNLKSYDFVGGTMFWVKADIINSFFKKHSPLQIRSMLEYGNVLDHNNGTYSHSWERMLSWIANDKGYYIKGI